LLAKAFPNSDFVGYDYHVPSVETATERVKATGATNVRSEVADATGYKANNYYDLIAFFDCLHDLADPRAKCPEPDGSCMLVEPAFQCLRMTHSGHWLTALDLNVGLRPIHNTSSF
jgi:hypothetical protein